MIFYEMAAGLAAVSLHLRGHKPLFTRPGVKTGYAERICLVAGVTPQKPTSFMWSDPDPFVRRVLSAYGQPEELLAAAETLDVWAGEPAERVFHRERKNETLAAQLFAAGNSWKAQGLHWKAPRDPAWSACLRADRLAERLRVMAKAPVEAFVAEEAMEPPANADGYVVYVDPPYRGSTPYSHDTLPRERVVELCLAWWAAGARVVLSEGEPVVVHPAWRVLDITESRVGHVRRGSRQKREYLMVSV